MERGRGLEGNSFSKRSPSVTPSSHSIPKMRILQIRNIPLPQLPPQTFLLLAPDPTLPRQFLPLPILPDIVTPPATNQHELHAQTNTRARRAGNIPGSVFALEDLRATHIADAVAEEGGGGDEGFLGAAGDVGRDEGPGEEEGEDVGHAHEVHAPLGPAVGGGVGQQGHTEESDEGWDAGCGHDVHAAVGDFAGVEADNEEDDEG